MMHLCGCIALGAAVGTVVALVGGYVVLMYMPDTLASL